MEADWSIELGEGMAVIDAQWSEWKDLRRHPQLIEELDEPGLLPALGKLLRRLNAADSGFWTSKCDFWRVEDAVDPYELESDANSCRIALSCYIDLLAVDGTTWRAVEESKRWAAACVGRLRSRQCSHSRVDVVLRRAILVTEKADSSQPDSAFNLATTIYVTGCGSDEQNAIKSLESAMEALITALLPRCE